MLAGAGVLALALSAGVAVQAQRLVSDKVAELRSDDNVDAAGLGPAVAVLQQRADRTRAVAQLYASAAIA